MYILAVKYRRDSTVQRVVAKTKANAFAACDVSDCLAWRLHDGSGWCDGTPNAYAHISDPNGPAVVIL